MSAPGLSWDTMLKMKKMNLELIPDFDILIFFEKDRRGGISYVSNRYSKVNKEYLKFYDSKQEWKHITYLDANNLYGYPIYQFLPASGFKLIDWVWLEYTRNNSKVCVLEVNLEYPKELHKLHKNTSRIKIQSITVIKTIYWIQYAKKNRIRKR